jgi:peptidoglycan biosynthesis protein MviN/MurJ (putative lipid II flippase)
VKRTIGIAVVSAAGLALTFMVQWWTVRVIGSGPVTDALFAGTLLPSMVLAIVGQSLSNVLVPTFANLRDDEHMVAVWNYVCLTGAVFSALALVLSVTAAVWVPLIVPGLPPDAAGLAVQLTRIQLVGMVFTAVAGVLSASLNARNIFVGTELAATAAAAIAFAGLVWIVPRFGVWGASVCLSARPLLQTLFMLPKVTPIRRPAWQAGELRIVWDRLRPLILGTAYYKTDILVDRFLASLGGAGGLTNLHLAIQIHTSTLLLLGKAHTAPLLPRLSVLAGQRNWTEFWRIVGRELLRLLAVVLLGYAFMLAFGRQMLQLLFGSARMSPSDVRELWTILLLCGGIWIVGPLGRLVTTAFYARGETSTPTRLGAYSHSAGIVVKIAGFWLFGIKGLAAAISVYYGISALLLSVGIYKDWRHSFDDECEPM